MGELSRKAAFYVCAVAGIANDNRSLQTIAFDSAGIISDLCTALSQHGSQITHPFAGFAALAAGTLHAHLYV